MSPTRRELVRATRARILDAAARLLRDRGPNGFSMDVLAREAGVARATVYEHFRSKRAVLDELASSTVRAITLEPKPNGDGDALRALRDLLSEVCRHWAAHEDTMRELRTLHAITGSSAAPTAVASETLHSLATDLAAASQLRTHWSIDEAADALGVLTSYATYEQLRRAREREQVEGVLAKLAVAIIAPGAVNAV